MITLLTGDNHFLLSKRKDEIEEAFSAKQPDGWGLERFESEDDEIERLSEALTVLPFLAGERLVLIRGATRNSTVSQEIVPLLERIPETTHAVFLEPSPDRRTSLYKALQNHAVVETFEPLRGQALQNWVMDYASEQGAKISAQSANELIRRVGIDQWALSQEVTKLSLLDQPAIEIEHIRLYTEPTLRESIFDLLELLLAGKGQEAVRVYRELRSARVESFEIIAMIGWQIQLLTSVALGSSRSTTAIARETGFKPFSLERAAVPARRLKLSSLRQIVTIFSSVDSRMKRSRADKDAMLELALVRSAELLS